ncbi:MAG TPA: DUF2207 domain-containing protein, partial [Anaerolineae bacterium]|nr:DUF2207 domain-containing protein [Anaerolineae bacterium]
MGAAYMTAPGSQIKPGGVLLAAAFAPTPEMETIRRKEMRGKRWLWLTGVLALLLLLVGTAQAQDKSYYWERLDVEITVLPNADMEIVETQEFVFIGGPFRYVYRDIPTDKLEAITDVEVWEGDRQYAPGRKGEYTYATSREGDTFRITWWYPSTRDTTRTFTLKYTVKGGLRIYEGGDQVWWKAVFPDRDVPVRSSTVTIHLPADFSADQLKIASYGAPAESRIVDGRTVVFEARNIAPGEELEVRVQFPHGVVQAAPPAWQAAADRRTAYEEQTKPLVNLVLGFLGLLVAVAGSAGLYLLWYTRGRDVPVGPVA